MRLQRESGSLKSAFRQSMTCFLCAALASALLAGTGVFAQGQGSNPTPENKPMKPFRVIGNIYWVGLTDHGAFLVTTPSGHLLLDTTAPETAPVVRASIEQLGFKLSDIKIIIGAHPHNDHLGAASIFKEWTGATFIMLGPDAAVMADGGRSDFREDGREIFKPIKADRIIGDMEEVHLDKMTFVAHLTPGHTRGCTTWTTVVEDSGKKYNVVFVCGVETVERVPLINNAKYPEIVDDFTKSFTVLRSLPCDVFLFTRAGFINLEGKRKLLEQGATHNPFIDPQECREYIVEREKMVEDQMAKERGNR